MSRDGGKQKNQLTGAPFPPTCRPIAPFIDNSSHGQVNHTLHRAERVWRAMQVLHCGSVVTPVRKVHGTRARKPVEEWREESL